MDKKDEVLRILPGRVREAIAGSRVGFVDWQEIRLRAGQPLLLRTGGERQFGAKKGEYVFPSIVTDADIRECLQAAANYSLYAYEDEVRQGFLTVRGGHRIGLAGHVVQEKGAAESAVPGQGSAGRVRTMKQVSSLNIRVAHEVRGCGEPLLKPLFGDGNRRNVLLISPPGAGKTTLLRELVRLLTTGLAAVGPLTVGVVDERSELAACYQGMPQHDLGPRADVLDGCPKATGIYMLLRSMAPDVIAVDEISLPEDARAVAYAAGCGCQFLATLHGCGMEALRRPALRELWEMQLFDRYVVMGQPAGRIIGVYDRNGRPLYQPGNHPTSSKEGRA